jgi:hypothetical protein
MGRAGECEGVVERLPRFRPGANRLSLQHLLLLHGLRYLRRLQSPANKNLPPLQGEGWGGDGLNPAPKQSHPPPDLPLEGGGTRFASAAISARLLSFGSSHSKRLPEAMQVYLYERGIQGDLPLALKIKSPLAPLSQRGSRRMMLVNQEY